MHRPSIIYRKANGSEPYSQFLESLKDRVGAAHIRARVTRAEYGNWGDWRWVDNGIVELRIRYGPGYRIYLGLRGPQIVVLCAGTKGNQRQDIRSARNYWKDYRQTL